MRISKLLMPAVTLAGALALAGCGGGSDAPANPDDGEEDETATCSDGSGGTFTIVGDKDDCPDLPEDTSAADATKAAKALHEHLGIAAVEAMSSRPNNSGTTSSHLEAAFGKADDADDGMGSNMKAQVLVMSTKGGQIETTTRPGAGGLVEANAKYISGSGFATGSELKTHKDGAEVTGSYAGAPGKYTCSDDDCTSQRGSGGVVLGGTGTWAFLADAREPKYKGDDPHYAEFGWWLDEGISGATDDKVGAWYDIKRPSSGLLTTGNVTNASGSATYSGRAVGQAALYDPRADDNVGGSFTASASLTADFDKNMLKGDITGFKVGGTDVNWSVKLVEKAITTSDIESAVASNPNAGTEWTIDGTSANASGDWSAAFYEKPENQHQPKGVAGGFVSHYGTDGRMVGAFGAER